MSQDQAAWQYTNEVCPFCGAYLWVHIYHNQTFLTCTAPCQFDSLVGDGDHRDKYRKKQTEEADGDAS